MKRAFLLVIVLAGCQSAGRQSPYPRALAVTWIGVASDGLTWYRLDLDDEGKGSCATTSGAGTAHYRVRQWSEQEEVTVHLEIVDGPPAAPPRLDLRGSAKPWRLDLAVEGLHTLTLWREKDLLDARERMMRHGSTTTANPP